MLNVVDEIAFKDADNFLKMRLTTVKINDNLWTAHVLKLLSKCLQQGF